LLPRKIRLRGERVGLRTGASAVITKLIDGKPATVDDEGLSASRRTAPTMF